MCVCVCLWLQATLADATKIATKTIEMKAIVNTILVVTMWRVDGDSKARL